MRVSIHSFTLPRHPLLRALALAAGTVLLIGLLALGLAVGAVAIVVAALVLLLRRGLAGRKRRHADPDIIEGEFTVTPRQPRAALPRAE